MHPSMALTPKECRGPELLAPQPMQVGEERSTQNVIEKLAGGSHKQVVCRAHLPSLLEPGP